MSLKEEIDLISSIYSNPKEFCVEECYGDATSIFSELSFSMNLSCEDYKLVFNCHVHKGYPLKVPTVYLQHPTLQKSVNSKLQADLKNFLQVNEWIGQPMLFSIIDWLKENICCYFNTESLTNKLASIDVTSEIQKSTCLLQLDHMRSRSRYVKHLQAFAKELNVNGFVIFACKLIFILLHGCDSSITEFIIKLKVQKVDIDSGGHPCKERMLKVLKKASDSHMLLGIDRSTSSFLDVKELNNFLELEQFLTEIKLQDVFKKLILPDVNY